LTLLIFQMIIPLSPLENPAPSRRPESLFPGQPPDELLDEVFQDDDGPNPDPIDENIPGEPKTDAASGNKALFHGRGIGRLFVS
jgi:hypothetical protein